MHICTHTCSGGVNGQPLAIYHEFEDKSSSKEGTINWSRKGDKYLPLLIIYTSP